MAVSGGKKKPKQAKKPALEGFGSDASLEEEGGIFCGHKTNNLQPEPNHFIVKWNELLLINLRVYYYASVMLKSEQQIRLGSSYRS